MPCYHPMKAYRSRTGRNPSGAWPITFKISEGYKDLKVEIPCGQCIGCRLERSRQWAIRCMHEASLHNENCFITLTFSDEHLNKTGSLEKEDFQKFMKRLRKWIEPIKVRYFHCGEYGEQLGRPHHHACLFGVDFPDRKFYKERKGVKLYTSEFLERIWSKGMCTVGDVTFESAAYVARYIMKKITGEKAEEHYEGKVPEYVTMSRRPGIAADWIKEFKADVYPDDEVIVREGIRCRPPKFYDKLFEIIDPDEYIRIKAKRCTEARKPSDRDLNAAEVIKLSQLNMLRREIEK